MAQQQNHYPRLSLQGLPDELLEQCIGWAVTSPPHWMSRNTSTMYPKNVVDLEEENKKDPIVDSWLLAHPNGAHTLSRDQILQCASAKSRMLSPFCDCRQNNTKLWIIAVDQYYKRNVFFAPAAVEQSSWSATYGRIVLSCSLLNTPQERAQTRNLIVGVQIDYIPSDLQESSKIFGAWWLDVIQQVPEVYTNLRNLTIRIEHISDDAQEAAMTGYFQGLQPGEVKQSRMRLERSFYVKLFATLRVLEGANLRGRFVELKQIKPIFFDGRKSCPEDFADVEATEDDDLLAWRLQDLPMGRVNL